MSVTRQLRRIDGVSRSPIYAHFDEAISGASSIRAYRRSNSFVMKSNQLVDESQRAWFMIISCYRYKHFFCCITINMRMIVIDANSYAYVKVCHVGHPPGYPQYTDRCLFDQIGSSINVNIFMSVQTLQFLRPPPPPTQEKRVHINIF